MYIKSFFFIATCILFLVPLSSGAQSTAEDMTPARVREVVSEKSSILPGTEVQQVEQTLEAEITSGSGKGNIITVSNNYVPLEAGDTFIAAKSIDLEGNAQYFVQDVDRRGFVALFAILFGVAVIIISGRTGIRSLVSLGVSFTAIFVILLPLILAGVPPFLAVSGVAALILASVMYGTHGWSSTTHAAFLGTSATVVLAGILAKLAVSLSHLSGFAADEAVYLNVSTRGELDLAGLLLGAMIIGVLGLLDDIAVTQAATVAELKRSAPHLSSRELYHRAMSVGKEHIGALVNTLALAYAGVSLPLLLLFVQSDAPLWMLLNQEIFATEIIRTAVGGIALVLAAPLTTWLAIRFVKKAAEHSHHAHVH